MLTDESKSDDGSTRRNRLDVYRYMGCTAMVFFDADTSAYKIHIFKGGAVDVFDAKNGGEAAEKIRFSVDAYRSRKRRLADQPEIDRAIPVGDRLPPSFVDCVAYCRIHERWEKTCHNRTQLPGSPGFDPESSDWVGDVECRYTHWRPMPAKP